MKYDTWIIHSKKIVQVTDLPGPPIEVCGFISEEAAKAAEARGHATVSEIGFPREVYKGFDDWDEAVTYATQKAKELRYELDLYDSAYDWIDDDYEDPYEWD